MKILFADLLPGETPIDDASGLRVPGITTRKQLSALEAENIRKVLVKYFANPASNTTIPFDLGWSVNLHREMYGDVWDWAGRFRARDFNIGVHFPQIQECLQNLFENLHYWKQSGMDLTEQAARVHHGAVQIHPFVNGNGRWGRMITNIWFADQKSSVVNWPEEAIGSISPIRDEYIASLRKADAGEFDTFIEMHRKYLAVN